MARARALGAPAPWLAPPSSWDVNPLPLWSQDVGLSVGSLRSKVKALGPLPASPKDEQHKEEPWAPVRHLDHGHPSGGQRFLAPSPRRGLLAGAEPQNYGPPSHSDVLPSWAEDDVDEDHRRTVTVPIALALRSLRPRTQMGAPGPVVYRREEPLEEVDLKGGNGKWRQRKAEVEFEKRSIKEEERRREEAERRRKERRRQKEAEERKKQRQQDQQRQWQEERERRQKEEDEKERRRQADLERERRLAAEEERKRLARQPKPCQECRGTGHCPKCDGQGWILSMLLSPRVGDALPRTSSLIQTEAFGHVPRGCEACGAENTGVCGDLWHGNGQCKTCSGKGFLSQNNV